MGSVSLVEKLDFLQGQGITELKGFDFSDLWSLYSKLKDGSITRDEVCDLFMMGLTSGEVMRFTDLYNSRQALYFKATSKYGKDYKAINVVKRNELKELMQYYFGYVKLEADGDLKFAQDNFDGSKKSLIEYYIKNGGTRELWEDGSVSQSTYTKFFPYMNRKESIEKVIEQLKVADDLTDLDRELLQLTDREIESLKAGFGRIKKKLVAEDILRGLTKSEIIAKHFISEGQYASHMTSVRNNVLTVYKQHEGMSNIKQYLKYKLRVTGKNVDVVLDWVIRHK